MSKKAIWIGLAVSACGLALLSKAQADERNEKTALTFETTPRPDDSPRAVAKRGARQAQAPALQLPTTASTSPLTVLLGSGLVAVAIGWAAIRKYVTAPSA